MDQNSDSPRPRISVGPVLQRLRPTQVREPDVTADEVAFAVSHMLTNELSPLQAAILLYNLHITGLDVRADILAHCAAALRDAAVPVDVEKLDSVVRSRRRAFADYHGGLCDIVGTGGDGHSVFNVSTAASIVASALLMVAKHGSRAATSKSGSADVLASMTVPDHPRLDAVDPILLHTMYKTTNYAFLFASNFHKGMRYVAPIRKEVPHPTIFNHLGPLAHPTNAIIEARVLGVKKTELVDVFAEALVMGGAKKALVVCGAEDLDEISCAGPTHCSWISERRNRVEILRFKVSPDDFGLPPHPLSEVSPGQGPLENAEKMKELLSDELPDDDPVLHFVLINTAAMFVVSGICNGDKSAFGDDGAVITEEGPAGGRWKEGVRLARLAIKSHKALSMFQGFVDVTNEISN